MEIILQLMLIQIITVIIVEKSGIVEVAKALLSRILTKGLIGAMNYDLKPLDCSFCMNFWLGLIFIICIGEFNIPMLAVILGLSVLTPVTTDAITLVKDILSKANRVLYDILKLNE